MIHRVPTLLLAAALLIPAGAASAADWPMWGRTSDRRMNSPEKNPPLEWDVESGQNIRWSGQLGSQSYGNPVIAGGLVIVGTNNEAKRDSRFDADGGVLKIFRESDGQFLWQQYNPKLRSGRVNDWPFQGICSTPVAEGDFIWYATNRCEVYCLDLSPLRKGEAEPKVVWKVDMMAELGVFPHNMTSCSPLIHGDLVYFITGNGVDDSHKVVPASRAPSIVAFNKKTGKVAWQDNPDGPRILHGNWASPAIAVIDDRALLIAPLGDSWLYAYDAQTGKLVWKFDTNFKHTTYPAIRNELIATPIIVGKRLYIATGQDPEHGEGPGILWCLDITRTGDISLEIDGEPLNISPDQELLGPASGTRISRGKPNPNSGVIWHFTGEDLNGDGRLQTRERMNRTIGTCAYADGLLFIMDFSGFLHCFDAETGKRHWAYDLQAATWSSPLIVDGKVYAADEDGDIAIFKVSSTMEKLAEMNVGSAVYTSPVFANGVLYIANRDRVFAIGPKK